MANNDWSPEEYRSTFGFVTSHGQALLDLLAAVPGERVLDLGCGTGEHAASLASSDVEVVGIDADENMLAAARASFPQVTFERVDVVQDTPSLGTFDAVVSNAALHWMKPQPRALAYARACLRTGGRFVAEMGGHGNVLHLRRAFEQALEQCDLAALPVEENWFPSIPVEAALLEDAGFEVVDMSLFDRPTPLAAGSSAADWCAHFRSGTWNRVPLDVRPRLRALIDDLAAPHLFGAEGWWADYRRLRFVAIAR